MLLETLLGKLRVVAPWVPQSLRFHLTQILLTQYSGAALTLRKPSTKLAGTREPTKKARETHIDVKRYRNPIKIQNWKP